MFQQTLTYLYPSSANGFFLVQLTDHLVVIVDRIVLFPFLICLDVEDHPQGPVVSQSCSRWCHWSSSCPLVDSSVFHPQILVSARSFFWNVLFFLVHLMICLTIISFPVLLCHLLFPHISSLSPSCHIEVSPSL